MSTGELVRPRTGDGKFLENKQVTCPHCSQSLKLKRADKHNCVRAGRVRVVEHHLELVVIS